jgi:hypothetical protein
MIGTTMAWYDGEILGLDPNPLHLIERDLIAASVESPVVRADSCAAISWAMARDGHSVTPELVASTSSYMREQIRRFGRFTLDPEYAPTPKKMPILLKRVWQTDMKK